MPLKPRNILLTTLLFIVGCSQPHSPEESIQSFYESLNKQNHPELISFFNFNERSESKESEAELYELLAIIFQDLDLNIQEKGGIQKIEYHSIEYNAEKDIAVVHYTLYFNDLTNVLDTLTLVKDHTGYWQLTLE